MMKSLNLCIDIDGTITEPYYWIPRASEYFKTHIEYKNVIFLADLFIEDRYENALQLAQAGFEVLLIDCHYNQGDLPSNVTRVKHWIQIEKLIDSFSQQYDQLKVAL